ncbi:hypothetical protein H5203_18845 [Pseudoalteromonas sp. SG41-1]|uniref:hypothetical protein n=1 Tax=Pseudoalteromonas sp. SG41-1 TaxID=2760979 RepID=UPI001603B1BD|nr:hypothetical protein [Pseudoalteromonas sp. SG41-1]MBB1507527.1 hypothetical protein [Pseudoalteromonas sp. SG41-1]
MGYGSVVVAYTMKKISEECEFLDRFVKSNKKHLLSQSVKMYGNAIDDGNTDIEEIKHHYFFNGLIVSQRDIITNGVFDFRKYKLNSVENFLKNEIDEGEHENYKHKIEKFINLKIF